jgi:hypothetical protein
LTTPLDIITDALEKLGVYAPGEKISGADTERGMNLLDDLIDQWRNDSIQLFQLISIVASLQVDTQLYLVGPGGTIAAPSAPQRVVIGPGEASLLASAASSLVDSVSDVEWNAMYNTQNLGIPSVMYYSFAFPLGSLFVSPIPAVAGMTLTFDGYYPLGNYTVGPPSIPDIEHAPGQRIGLASNLAMLIHSYFSVGQITPDLIAQAQQSKTTLTLTNRLSRAMSARNVAPQTPAAPRP